MPGQSQPILQWPYTEGLRLDEAMHPLTIVAVGLYGKTLLNQNGAPLRLVVPWKYGFKSIKSIVRIRFVSAQPRTGVEHRECRRVRLLREREPRQWIIRAGVRHASGAWRRSSESSDTHVQRLRRSGGVDVFGNGLGGVESYQL